MRARVAAFMGGPVLARGSSGDERDEDARAERVRSEVGKYMLRDWISEMEMEMEV
jgi:hypothetical protein